jgi:hypothetical protein
MTPTGVEWSRSFIAGSDGAMPFGAQLVIALMLGALSSYIGLWFGRWMTKVRR